MDHLSLSDLSAVELIEVAAKLGCAGVSLFVLPLPLGPYRDLINDRRARLEVQAALRDTGLSVGVVEPFMLDANSDWEMFKRTAEVAAELGGSMNALGFDTDPSRLSAGVCRLAEIGRAAGAKLVLEAFTLSQIRSQAAALALAQEAGPDVGLTVDTLHVIRTGGGWEDILALPRDRIAHVQFSDGPLMPPADLLLEATLERAPPGQGEFDLARLLPLVPLHASLAIEAPFRVPRPMTPLERGRVLTDAMRHLLE